MKKDFCLWKFFLENMTTQIHFFLIFILDGGDGDDYGMKRNLFSFCQKIIRFFRLYGVGKKYEKKCKFFRIFERIYFFSKWAALKDLPRIEKFQNTFCHTWIHTSVTKLLWFLYPYSHPHCVPILWVFLGVPVPVLTLKNLYFFSKLR